MPPTNLFGLGYGVGPAGYGYPSVGRWSPLSLGSSLAAWYKADAGCYTDAACLFASASSQYLSRTGSAILRGAASGWWLSCWVYMNSAAANFDIHGCVTAFTSGRLLRVMSTGRVDLVACNAGAFAQVTHTTNIGTGAWHFVYAQYDGVNIGVSIDGGALQTAALASYVPGSNAFAVGNDTAINDFFDGRIARFFGGDGTLSAGQITSLYNAGAGLFYADLGATLQAACGFAYNLCEASGDRVDSVGALNLTPTNGPTVAAGPGEGLCVNNSPVKRWESMYGSAHLVQATIANQPIWRASILNGRGVVDFDGVSDYLAASGLLMGATYTCGALTERSGSANRYLIGAGSTPGAVSLISRYAADFEFFGASPRIVIAATDAAASGFHSTVFGGGSGGMATRFDGAASATSATAAPTGDGDFTIGAPSGVASDFFDGQVSEVVLSTAYTAPILASLDSYLNARR